MKPSFFTKSFKILIVTLLLLTLLSNRVLSQCLMLAVILGWILQSAGIRFGPMLLRFMKNLYADRQSRKQCTPILLPDATKIEDIIEAPPSTPFPEPATAVSGDKKRRMLQHISLRITEKIKSAYPDVTWRWDTSPCLSDILDGKTFRIQTDDMASYSHADVSFDQYGRIHITPLIIGDFSQAGNPDPSAEDAAKEPPVIDVLSWYDLIGRQILESVITDLNANGHSRLTIKENGDIIITRNKKEALKGTLTQFPPKNYWNEFLHLLEEYELYGKIEKDRIIVSWI